MFCKVDVIPEIHNGRRVDVKDMGSIIEDDMT